MTNEEINYKIAEILGWVRGFTLDEYWVEDPNGIRRGWSKFQEKADHYLPDFCNDLNAMHEAEASLTDAEHLLFSEQLAYVVGKSGKAHGCSKPNWRRYYVSASAQQRAKAYFRYLNIIQQRREGV